MKKLYLMLKNFIFAIFFAFIFWMTLMSVFTVCYMNSVEHTFFVKSSVSDILLKIALLFIVVAAGCFLKKKTKTDFLEKNEKIIECVLLGVILMICLVWVLLVRSNAVSDQLEVLNAAIGLKNGDYSAFVPGGYISYYTVQMGMVLVHYVCAILFGEYNYLAFQVISSFAVMFTWKQLYDISKLMNNSIVIRMLTLILGIFFLPYTFYSSFVYGTVLGFALSLTAIKYEIKFLKSEEWKYGITSAIFIALGILVKSNYLIFLVGMLAMLFMHAIEKHNKNTYVKIIVTALLMCVLYIVQGRASFGFVEAKTGQTFDNSMSQIAWLEMGLQDNGSRGPGWYNAYNYNTYFEASCDASVQKERVKLDLVNTINDMKSHKGDTVKFFSRKMASQWLNPGFQSLWTVQQTGTTKRDRANFVIRLIGPVGNIKFTYVYSFAEFLLLFGILMYCICKCAEIVSSKADMSEALHIEELASFIIEIVFIGGFVFYMFWEAKGQYTIVYMVMLSLLSAIGYYKLICFCENELNKRKDKSEATSYEINVKKTSYIVCSVAILMLVISRIVTPVWFMIRPCEEDTEFVRYKEFYLSDSYESINEEIILIPALNENVALINDGEMLICIGKDDESVKRIKPLRQGNTYRLMFSDGRYLNGYMNSDLSYNIEAGTVAENDGQFFRIDKCEDGVGYRITLSSGYALAYSEDSNIVYMTEISDSYNQRWFLQ